ncbi:MAG TPA: CehA/McbA family metallohydrolase [Polyangiaceae bacterium]|nr:CehA/McbA family metallohydrolase [Polyangiaceae bacterium]
MRFSVTCSPLLGQILAACLLAACGGDDGQAPGPSSSIDAGKPDVTSPPTPDAGEEPDPTPPAEAGLETGSDMTPDTGRDGADPVADATSTSDARTGDIAADAASDPGATDTGRTDTDGIDSESNDGGVDTGGPTTPRLWLKGDLHIHSNHSTDAMDTTVTEVIAKAESLGFDYFVLTDHDNHVEGKISTWSDPGYHSDKLVLLYGAEWTTAKGHANIFGTKAYDYAPIWAARDGDGAASVAIAHGQGLHFSVNHPAAKDLWEWGFELAYDSMEVWTAPFVFPDANSAAITKWDEILLGGRQLAARGGSDSHHQHDLESTLFNTGNPTTWIYSRAKTGEALLEGLKAGHVSVSYAATAERIDFTGDVDGDGAFETVVGDNVRPVDGKSIRFKIEIAGFRATSTYNVTVFKNGVSFKNWQLTSASVTFEDAPASGERAYYRVEVRGPTSDAPIISSIAFGDFIALTNPIYVSFP